MALLRFLLFALLLSAVLPAAGNAEPPKPPPQPKSEPRPRTDRHGDPLPPGVIARLGTRRFRGVRGCLAFSPDGKLLAAATGGGERVTLWDAKTGREIRQIAGSELEFLRCLAFSPDGKRLACSTESSRCRVVDVASGKELFAVNGRHGHFSGDGKTLVTADAFNMPARIHVWEAATGRLLRQWPAGQSVKVLSLADDGRTLALIDNADPAAVKIHDLIKGRMVRSIRLGAKAQYSAALSRDGKTVATANNKGTRLWDAGSGKDIGGWNYRVETGPVFSPDGKRLAWTGYNGAKGLWLVARDGSKPRAIGERVIDSQPPCFSPDGKVVAFVTDAHAVSLRAVDTGKEIVALDAHDGPVTGLALTPDGSRVISRARTGIFTWETRTGRLLRRSPGTFPGHEYIEALLPDGRLLTSERMQFGKERYRLRDGPMGREVWRFEGRCSQVGPPLARIAADGSHAVVCGPDEELCLLDVRNGQCDYRLGPLDARSWPQLSNDGDVLVRYHRTPTGNKLHVHRHATKKELVLRDLPKGGSGPMWRVSPNGHWLVLSQSDGSLRRWDLTTGKELSPLTALRYVTDLSWSPDGRFVAARGPAPDHMKTRHRDLRVWDAAIGTPLRHFTLPDTRGCVFFSHDSRTLLTTDMLLTKERGIIHLWEVATGKERARLQGHLSYEIGSLALSIDGRMLVSGGHDSQVLVWDLTGRAPDGQWHTVRHPPEKLRATWETLASNDANAAYAAMWQLAADPEGTTALLRERLRPVSQPMAGKVTQLIAALDSEKFAERQRATRELETLEEVAAAELRQTLTRKPSLEVRRRVETLLERLNRPLTGSQLKSLRAIEVLEYVGTPEARQILKTLAEGAPEAHTTREAKATQTRLERRAREQP